MKTYLLYVDFEPIPELLPKKTGQWRVYSCCEVENPKNGSIFGHLKNNIFGDMLIMTAIRPYHKGVFIKPNSIFKATNAALNAEQSQASPS